MHLGPLYSLTENGIHYHYLCLPGPALMVLLCVGSLEACTPCTETQPSVLSSKPALLPALLSLHGSFSLLRLVVPVSPDFACLCQESRPEVREELSIHSF